MPTKLENDYMQTVIVALPQVVDELRKLNENLGILVERQDFIVFSEAINKLVKTRTEADDTK